MRRLSASFSAVRVLSFARATTDHGIVKLSIRGDSILDGFRRRNNDGRRFKAPTAAARLRDAVTTDRPLRAQLQAQVVQWIDCRARPVRNAASALRLHSAWGRYEQLIHFIAHGPSESLPQNVSRKTSPGRARTERMRGP
jgi:hypothetical protein